jgi:hypothetical protein
MTLSRGSVVVGENPFSRAIARSYLVVSNDQHSFADEECICLGVTTTERERAVSLSGEYVGGGLPIESYVTPWSGVL